MRMTLLKTMLEVLEKNPSVARNMNFSLKLEKQLAEIIENSTRWDNGWNDSKDCESAYSA